VTTIVGDGRYRYAWDGGWLKLPPGIALGHTHGIVRARDGRCVVFNQSRDAIIIVDADGRYLGSWGSEFAAGAHGLTIVAEGDGDALWLTDHRRAIVSKRTLDGVELMRLPVPRLGDLYANADEYQPTEAAVADDGTIFVADGYGKHWIHRFAADGAYLDSFGGAVERGFSRCRMWEDPGRLEQPHGLRVIGGELVVADRRRNRLQVFSLAGEHRRFIHGVRYPCSVVEGPGGELIVPDLYSCVHILSAEGAPLARIGDDPHAWDRPGWPDLDAATWRDGRFVAPHAVWADPGGDLIVAEWTPRGRVIRLARLA